MNELIKKYQRQQVEEFLKHNPDLRKIKALDLKIAQAKKKYVEELKYK
jgi:hypothetical protein